LSDYEGAETDPIGTAVRLIVSSVARWDILTKAGVRHPITPASVRELPAWLVLDIAGAIAADVRLLVVAEIERQRMTAA